MDIKSFGGEFKLIENLKRPPRFHPVTVGIGDDAAVLPWGKKHLVVTQDMLVEGDHFSLDYFTAYAVGVKAMESNFSDIAAMGASPAYAFVSLSLKRDTQVEWVKDLYRGMRQRCRKRLVDLVGGDTTHAKLICISVTVLGLASRKHLTLRRGGKVGHVIKVTGPLGASTAGFRLFQKEISGHDKVKKKHCFPNSRIDLVPLIAPYASAMADISDGLASDLKNILKASGVGAILDKQKIPIRRETIEAAEILKEDPWDYALFGGEDFELVFTVPESLASRIPGCTVGRLKKKKGLFLKDNDRIYPVSRGGFDHFA